MTPTELLDLQIRAAASVADQQQRLLGDQIVAAEQLAARQVNQAVCQAAVEMLQNPTS